MEQLPEPNRSHLPLKSFHPEILVASKATIPGLQVKQPAGDVMCSFPNIFYTCFPASSLGPGKGQDKIIKL